MQKIMFNDRYGLTQAVLDGRKTMTRRIEPICEILQRQFSGNISDTSREVKNHYALCEIVAVAQSYYDAFGMYPPSELSEHGAFNKMFVRADFMPHQIRITSIRIERLQEISDEDCLREGIRYITDINKYYFERTDRQEGFYFDTAREAFASLIDKVSGRGTWESNPYVVVYSFELVK